MGTRAPSLHALLPQSLLGGMCGLVRRCDIVRWWQLPPAGALWVFTSAPTILDQPGSGGRHPLRQENKTGRAAPTPLECRSSSNPARMPKGREASAHRLFPKHVSDLGLLPFYMVYNE